MVSTSNCRCCSSASVKAAINSSDSIQCIVTAGVENEVIPKTSCCQPVEYREDIGPGDQNSSDTFTKDANCDPVQSYDQLNVGMGGPTPCDQTVEYGGDRLGRVDERKSCNCCSEKEKASGTTAGMDALALKASCIQKNGNDNESPAEMSDNEPLNACGIAKITGGLDGCTLKAPRIRGLADEDNSCIQESQKSCDELDCRPSEKEQTTNEQPNQQSGCTSSCCDKKDLSNVAVVEKTCLDKCCASGTPPEQSTKPRKFSDIMGDCCDTTVTSPVACPCCIADIIRGVTPTRLVPDNVEFVSDRPEECTEKLRHCCAILERCCRRACCFLTAPPGMLNCMPRFVRACEAESTEDFQMLMSTRQNTQAPKAGSTILQLEIEGMDCVDCVPKVARVLSRLPSVTAVETDYFAGIAQLRFDPEQISSTAIVSYLTRATGFRVKEITRKSAETLAHMSLPVFFEGRPPAVVMANYDVSRASAKDTWSISFCTAGKNPLLPRQVLADLEGHGARLAPEPNELNDPATRDLRKLVIRTTLCVMCTVPVLVLVWAPLPQSAVLRGGVSAGLATIVQLLAFPIYSSSVRSILFIHQIDLNVLAAVSMLLSYIFSLIAYAFEVAHHPFSASFFETSTLLVTLIYLGRTVQGVTRKSTGSAIRTLHHLQTKEVRVIDGETSTTVDSRLLHYGDCIEILPNTRIVTDGVVLSGSSDVDESSVTGESAPVPKFRGSRVIAGTINLNGILHVQVTLLLHENSLAKITQLVRQAHSSRLPLQDLADRLSAIILPLAAIVAVLAFVVWAIVNVFVRNRTKADAVVDGLMHAIAVLVVSCPCAIGLAVPTVTAVSMQVLARSGILVRSADILHAMRCVTVVAFDKTGTLSQGDFTVVHSDVFVEGAERVIYELVKGNSHPIARGMHRFLTPTILVNHEEKTTFLSDISALPGKGIRANVDGYELLGGSALFTGAASHPTITKYLTSGLSLFTVTLGGTCLAVYSLADLPRPEAPRLIESLKTAGKTVVLLSGDNNAAVMGFAKQIGIDEANVHAECSPEDKQAFIQSLRNEKHEKVLFVGDGTNDAPALATTDAALAVVSSSDVARTSAGAVLLHPDVEQGVKLLFRIAADADCRARIALGWCVVYMVSAMVLASGVAVKVWIEPRWAGLGEVVSVLPVVLVGLSIKWRHTTKRRSNIA